MSDTTLGIFMATLDSSIVLISLPAICRGIHLDPLQPSNISFLLWMLMGYLVVTAVLVVTFGRLGDMFGRAKMYHAGFAAFTAASIALSLCPLDGAGGDPAGPGRHIARPAARQAARITGKTFFLQLISDPLLSGLRIAFTVSMTMCLIAAASSWVRGKHQRASEDDDVLRQRAEAGAPVEERVPG